MSVIGIVCGLKSEVEALASLEGARIRVSGASAGKAEALARALAEEGATALLSVGLAGGLRPEARSGMLLLPQSVRLPDGSTIPADAALLQRLQTLLQLPAGPVAAGVDAAIMDPMAKAELARSGAAIVDMETHGVARAARDAGLPWAAVRAVADDCTTALPAWAMGLVREDGSINDAQAALALLKAPWDLPLALRLAGANAKALAALRGAAAALRDAASEPAAQ